MTKEKTVTITIDNRKLDVRSNLTILQAARQKEIYIPSLCAFEHLPSYGACRLCVVEVDGLRGFPTACTTPVEPGMVIRTETAELRSLRQEILKLLLSEHPASCLFCGEQSECKEYQGTIRKVGATTGCRYCPNDYRCELQEITEKIGLTETSYPVYYRGFPVEKNDPFYDRDYNLCILCGRCVRVCTSVRHNGALSFKQRGKVTTIGPAFDRTHMDAGCEFCGACVSACPTGALSTKVSKWYGKPETQVATTCTYCSVGCSLLLQVKNNYVLDALADYDSPVDGGLICVKGRFAVPEYLHSPARIANPRYLTAEGYEEIGWDKAVEVTTQTLSGVAPDEILFVVSPDLTCEDMYAARELAVAVSAPGSVTSPVLAELGSDFAAFVELLTLSSPFRSIEEADALIAVGFDSSFGYSPAGIGIKKAVERGGSLITLNREESNLDILADASFVAGSSLWSDLMDRFLGLARARGHKKPSGLPAGFDGDVKRAQGIFGSSSKKVVVAGPGIIDVPERGEIIRKLIALQKETACSVVLLHPYTNLTGMLVTGLVPGIEPGQILWKESNGAPLKIGDPLASVDLTKRRKVIYLIGETPFEGLPECDYLIYQNGISVPFTREPDLILPAALFGESPGTLINSDGRLRPVAKAIEPFMDAKPDWWTLSAVAAAIKKNKPKYGDLSSIQREIGRYVKGFPSTKKTLRFVRVDSAGTRAKSRKNPLVRGWKGSGSYRGIPLSHVVSGMKTIENRDQKAPCEKETA